MVDGQTPDLLNVNAQPTQLNLHDAGMVVKGHRHVTAARRRVSFPDADPGYHTALSLIDALDLIWV